MKKLRIKNKISEISEYLPKYKNGVIVVPVDLRIILKKYDLEAYEIKFRKESVAGAFDRSKREIYLNETDPYTRKVFTLAHELGHYFLHNDVASDILYREKNDDIKNKQQEQEANRFAAELLMPEETIKAYWTVAENITQLAEIFGVSYLAMQNRLTSLGLI